MSGVTQHVLNIPAGRPFARTLAGVLLDEVSGDPEALARYKILLPTRRACRVLQNAFLSESAGQALLLPQMTPLGDVEEEDLALMMFGDDGTFLDLPPAMPPLRRRLLLARLIGAVPGYAMGHDHALALAEALGRFLDHVTTEGLDFGDLAKIVPEEFSAHWQITLDFLKIISEQWPLVLAENRVVDVAQRRNILLETLAAHWRSFPPQGPVIAAGSTGSIPATAGLLAVVAGLPYGRVILPGLDQDMDAQSWTVLAETHPQFGLKLLLERMGCSRGDVIDLCVQGGTISDARVSLAREIMRPAETAARWKGLNGQAFVSNALDGLCYYACETQQEEAMVVSLLLREVLQEDGRTAALVTPDRVLARRVSALCKRWGVDVDDSAGIPLEQSGVGKFLSLVMEAGRDSYNPVTLLSLMKHDLFFAQQTLGRSLEVEVLRQKERPLDFDVLRENAAAKFDGGMMEAFGLLEDSLGVLHDLQKVEGVVSFAAYLDAHIQVAENLCDRDDSGSSLLWRGDDGNCCATFLSDLREHATLIGSMPYEDYIRVFEMLLAGPTVRASYGRHPRLMILGQLEARLMDADLVVMSSLNEGSWPPDSGHDPWMSRPMRHAFGLPAAERAIGLAAHDFVQGFCAAKVVLTRSKRVDGTPSVPARWLERMDVVLQAAGLDIDSIEVGPHMGWAKKIDAHEKLNSCAAPLPCPPLPARPKRLSVTRVETWLRDPYSIYAREILKLYKMEPLVQESDAAMRGTILHDILEKFVRLYPVALPDDAKEALMACARDVLQAGGYVVGNEGYWWPRFEKIADWFLQHEESWREKAKFVGAELEGRAELDIDGDVFELYGRADRIDKVSGGYALIDYKSAGQFSVRALADGSLPQLPLEALILGKGRFAEKQSGKSLSSGPSAYLGYWKMTGGSEAGKEISVTDKVDAVVAKIEEVFADLVIAYRNPAMPYACLPNPALAPRYNDYEHLSRFKEWAVQDDAEPDYEEVA